MKITVFRNFCGTHIQTPGGSSFTKVLTRDCLSLLLNPRHGKRQEHAERRAACVNLLAWGTMLALNIHFFVDYELAVAMLCPFCVQPCG